MAKTRNVDSISQKEHFTTDEYNLIRRLLRVRESVFILLTPYKYVLNSPFIMAENHSPDISWLPIKSLLEQIKF